MKIAIDAQPLFDSCKTGIGYCERGVLRELLKKYPENSITLDFFSFTHREWKQSRLAEYQQLNCRFHECRWFSAKLFLLVNSVLPVLPYRLFFGKAADVTQFFNFVIPPFVSGKAVVTIHDMAFLACPETVRFRTRMSLKLNLKRTLKRADKIITVSEFSKREIIKYYSVPEEKIAVIPNAVDTSMYHNRHTEKEIREVCGRYHITGSYFLYLGTIEPRKNLVRLIKAYQRFQETKGNPPQLVIAGKKGWLYDDIFETVQGCGLEDKIVFTDYIPYEEAPVLMQGALAFCFPSVYEGFGMPPLEAMACGTPVITSSTTSLPEVVGDCALLVNPESIDEIAAALERIANDEKLQKELAEKGIERAGHFTWEYAADRYASLYREIVSQNNGGLENVQGDRKKQ